MPTKRTRTRRGRAVLDWNALDGHQWTHFALGWSPGVENNLGFETWSDYLTAWEAMRDQALAERDPDNGPMYWCEAVYQAYGADGPPPWDRELLRAKQIKDEHWERVTARYARGRTAT